MKRMRKERPTMALYPSAPLTSLPMSEAFGLWRATVGDSKDGIPMPIAMPLGNCPNPIPCGHCWYCLKRKELR